jgi:uncharacterized protein
MTSAYRKLFVILALCAAVCVSVANASTPEPPLTPRDYVVDLAGIIRGDAAARMNAVLRELEQKTTAQVLVLTIQSLDGQGIDDFALKTKEKWKLGQKGKDNGVLIVVSVKERKYRLEIGYGLEGVLPDSLVGAIGREYFVPYFRQGDYSTGIFAGAMAVVNTIATQEGVHITGMSGAQQPRAGRAGKPLGAFQMIVFGILGIAGLILFITHPGQCLLLIMASQMGGGRGGWSGGGGGFGGGGSFGGGGGGRGGGGGASGGW